MGGIAVNVLQDHLPLAHKWHSRRNLLLGWSGWCFCLIPPTWLMRLLSRAFERANSQGSAKGQANRQKCHGCHTSAASIGRTLVAQKLQNMLKPRVPAPGSTLLFAFMRVNCTRQERERESEQHRQDLSQTENDICPALYNLAIILENCRFMKPGWVLDWTLVDRVWDIGSMTHHIPWLMLCACAPFVSFRPCLAVILCHLCLAGNLPD